MARPRLSWLLAVALLVRAAAALTVGPITTTPSTGSLSYTWTLAKTIEGGPGPAAVRIAKGVTQNVNYELKYTRAIDPASKDFKVSGSFTLDNTAGPDPVDITSVSGTTSPGEATAFTPVCSPMTIPVGSVATCTFTDVVYNGFPEAGTVAVTVTYGTAAAPGQVATGTSPTFAYQGVTEKCKTATLADKFDTAQIDTLYTGFSNFRRQTVWDYVDPALAVPETGVTVSDGGSKAYAIRAGAFAVCTGTNGIAVTNTATLKSDAGCVITGSPATVTARVEVINCEVPPLVNFQELQTWWAQTYTWQLTSRALRNTFNVKNDVGAVTIDFTTQATATATTGAWAVSGAVFVSNTQPGILNIAQLRVSLSSGESAFPQCTLTSPFISSDGLVWGGANGLGTVATLPSNMWGGNTVGNALINGNMNGGIGGLGTFTQFILPEFASATCRFNITLKTQPNQGVTIVPQINWGFGGMYTLNQPTQETPRFYPTADHFFPVQGCITLTDTVTAGPLQAAVANGGPNQQQICVNGEAQLVQPPPLTYAMTATINPATTPDCQPGSEKTYSVQNQVQGNIVGGAPVTAKADPVQITVSCPQDLVVVDTASAAAVDNLNVVVGGFQTYRGGEHAWRVEKVADNDTLSLAVGSLPKTVTYTVRVTKQPASNNRYFVAGKITVTNPGATPVAVTAVSVTAGGAAVPAACPPGALTVAPGTPLVCTFNVTWNNAASAGQLGARVDTGDFSFYGAPASFDFTNPIEGGTKGEKAEVYDDTVGEAPAGAAGVPTKWWAVDGSAPPPKAEGIPLTTVDSREYVYTMQVGPFADTKSCGTYKITNTATVVPSEGSPLTAVKVVSLAVTGCKPVEETLQSADARVAVNVDVTSVSNLTGNSWKIKASADPASVTLSSPSKTAEAAFEVEFSKVPSTTHEVAGTVTVANPDPQAGVTLDGVTVTAEADIAKTVDAVCPGGSPLKLQGGATVTCTFSIPMTTATPGSLIATVTDEAGEVYSSTDLAFDYKKAAPKTSATAPECATATAGLIVGIPQYQPGGAAPNALPEGQRSQRICETTKVTVPANLGPLKAGQCGDAEVTHLASLTPLAAGAVAASLATPLAASVTGCAKAAGGAPLITVDVPEVEVQELYTWTAKLTSNVSGVLSFKQKEPAKVAFSSETTRAPVKRSAAVAGRVTLEAPTEAPLTIESATVAVYDGSATYNSAKLDCGAGSTPGGPVTLTGKGARVTCTYKATGVAASDGAVLPVIIAQGAAGPALASAATYSASSAPRNIVGDCADLGASLTLTTAAGKRASWQPAYVGQALGRGSDCEGGDTQRFSLWFGGNSQGEASSPPCGDYKFVGSLSLAPTNGEPVIADVEFPVKVACRRRSLLETAFYGGADYAAGGAR